MAEEQKHRPFFSGIEAFTDKASLLSAKAVSGILVAMMVLTSADIFLRFFLSKSIIGTVEIEGNYFMAAVIFLPLAYGMTARREHIRVEILTSHLSLRLRNALELFTLILSLFVFGLVTFYGFEGTWRSWSTGETMVNIALPIWPGRALVAIGGTLLCLQMMVKLLHLLKSLRQA
jgi:TRAP-type mannitol/chloroaromatic compound transport system permease small subunit